MITESNMANFVILAVHKLNESKNFGKLFVELKMEFARRYGRNLITSTFHSADFFNNLLFCLKGGDVNKLGEPNGEYKENFKKLIKLF